MVVDWLSPITHGSRWCVTGVGGSGKTTGIVQLLARWCRDDVVVVLHPSCTADYWKLANRMIGEPMPQSTARAVLADITGASSRV